MKKSAEGSEDVCVRNVCAVYYSGESDIMRTLDQCVFEGVCVCVLAERVTL